MKKKILGILICGILVLGMTGCSNDKTTTDKNNNKDVEVENNINNELLGKWTGASNGKSINGIKQGIVESTWFFDEDKIILTNYYNYLDEGKISWTGSYKIKDDSTVIINFDNWVYEREFSYKVKDGKYLDLINITDETEGIGFPSYEQLEKE